MGMTAGEPVPGNIAILAGSAHHLRLLMPWCLSQQGVSLRYDLAAEAGMFAAFGLHPRLSLMDVTVTYREH